MRMPHFYMHLFYYLYINYAPDPSKPIVTEVTCPFFCEMVTGVW